jgi:amino acid transporter
MIPNNPIDEIIKETDKNYSGKALKKPNLDRILNKMAGIFAILLGLYLTITDLLFGGFAGPIYFSVILILGPLSIFLGIHQLKKKSPSEKNEINLPRAIFIAFGVTILLFYLLMNVRF